MAKNSIKFDFFTLWRTQVALKSKIFKFLKNNPSCPPLPKKNFWCYDTRKSEDFDEIVDEYLKLDVSEYLEKPVPFVFLSFPSEKDPEYHERNPSKGQTGIIITGRGQHTKINFIDKNNEVLE